MRLIITNLRESHAEKGIDWIVMSANALAIVAMLAASASGNPFDYGDTPAHAASFEIASMR
ncbi:MAG: hypothetical protein AAF744_11725 [Pseudomonadota bacterium]